MAFNLVQAVEARLSPNTVDQIASHIGQSPATARSAMSAGVLAIVAGLTESGSNKDGAASLLSALRSRERLGASEEELEKGIQPQNLHERGQTLIASHFGGRAHQLADAVATSSGLGRHESASIVSMLAPLVSGVLAREVTTRQLDAVGLSSLLRDQRTSLLARGQLPTGIANMLRGGRIEEPVATRPVTAPEVRTGRAEEPVATRPVTAPEVRTREVRAPEVRTPEVRTPEVRTPEVRAPEVRASEARARDVRVETPVIDRERRSAPPVATSGVEHHRFPLGWIVSLAAAGAFLLLGLLLASGRRGISGVEAPIAREPAPTGLEVPREPQVPRAPVIPNVAPPTPPTEQTSETTTTGATLTPGDELSKHFSGGGSTPDRVGVPLTFEFAATTLSGDGEAEVERIAGLMKDNPNTRIRLEGFTDSTGNASANEKLSAARAEKVKEMLSARGVDPNRIETAARRDVEPVAPNVSNEGRAKNRRVEIIVIQR